MTMTSRERVWAALQRQPVDRVPIFMWYHPDTATRLARELAIAVEDLPEALGDDIRQTWVGNNAAMEGVRLTHDGETFVDDWGIEWVKEGPFNQIRRSPLADATAAAVEAYRFPAASIEALVARLDALAPASGRYFTGVDVSPCAFEMVNRLRGMEQAMIDLAADPALAARLTGAASDFAVQLAATALDRRALDWLWTGDDVGGQTGMIMSPACWREAIKPHLARVVAVGKARGVWVAYHSCGAVRPIIPDLIELGVDVLNPIQGNCPGMNPLELKKEFGRNLAFMGGVDTQGLLPTGSAAEVYRETRRLLEGMTADGGGYILAASHTVPPETPSENMFALYRAAGVTREEIQDRASALRQRQNDDGEKTG